MGKNYVFAEDLSPQDIEVDLASQTLRLRREAGTTPVRGVDQLLIRQNGELFQVSFDSIGALDAGMIAAFERTTAPSGWIALSGQTIVGGVATFPDLAAVYPTWVAGADLNLPNYQDKHLEGSGASVPGVNLPQSTAKPVGLAVGGAIAGGITHGTTGSPNNGQFGLAQRSSGGSNTATGADVTPGEVNFLNSQQNHYHDITGWDAKTRPASRTVLWCVKAQSSVVIAQPGTEVMTNVLTVDGGTVTSIVNGMPATANFAPESRVFFGAQIDPNAVAPIDPITGVAAIALVNGETFFQTDTGAQSGNKLAVWRYAGGAWHRETSFALQGTTTAGDGIRTYYPSQVVRQAQWTTPFTPATIAAHGFTGVGGGTVSNYAAYGSPAYYMLACNATRPACTTGANTLRETPTNCIMQEIAVKPTTANHYMLQLLTGGAAREVTVEVWLCNPTTGVPEKRLYAQTTNESGDTNAADCGSISRAPDNASAYEDWWRQWVGWEIPANLVAAYKTGSDTIKLALRPGADNGETNNFFICGYAMVESAHSMIHLPGMVLENTANIAVNRNVKNGGNSATSYGDYYGYGSVYVPPGQTRIFDLPLPDSSKDIYLNVHSLWRDGSDTDGYATPQAKFEIVHASGDVMLGRPRHDIIAPVSKQNRWGYKPMGWVIPASTLATKATQLSPVDAIPYLRIRMTTINNGNNAHFALFSHEQV